MIYLPSMKFGEQLRQARMEAGLTQAQLAKLAGTSQSRISSYEAGTVEPSGPTKARLLAVAKPLPGYALYHHRAEIKRLARKYHLKNVRIFGSVARHEDTRRSDIDLVVTPLEEASLFDVIAFGVHAEELIGYHVDVVSDRNRSEDDPVLAEALAL